MLLPSLKWLILQQEKDSIYCRLHSFAPPNPYSGYSGFTSKGFCHPANGKLRGNMVHMCFGRVFVSHVPTCPEGGTGWGGWGKEETGPGGGGGAMNLVLVKVGWGQGGGLQADIQLVTAKVIKRSLRWCFFLATKLGGAFFLATQLGLQFNRKVL